MSGLKTDKFFVGSQPLFNFPQVIHIKINIFINIAIAVYSVSINTIGSDIFNCKIPMGLDIKRRGWLNEYMFIKQLLSQLGFSAQGGVRGYVSSLLNGKKHRVSPLVEERESFEREVKDQFLKLKEKGLSIPIFTL